MPSVSESEVSKPFEFRGSTLLLLLAVFAFGVPTTLHELPLWIRTSSAFVAWPLLSGSAAALSFRNWLRLKRRQFFFEFILAMLSVGAFVIGAFFTSN
jgi:hypothetical protein